MEVDFDVGDENMDLVGTCNGLVCLGSHSGRLSIIWNPITREFRKYLETEISNSFGPKCLVYWGFGYVSTGDDYKIVRLCMNMSSHSLTVHVYSIRLDTWRVINNDAYDISNLSYPMLIRTSGLFINGTLYWRLPEAICSFNLESEKLDTFPPHLEVMISTPLSYVTFSNMLFVVNGCVSTYGPCRRGNDHIFTILKSPEVVEQIIVPKDVVGLMPYAGILIGFTRSDKIFTQYSRHRLGVIDVSLHPLNLTPLMKLGGRGVTEVVSYCATVQVLFHLNLCLIRTFKYKDSII
ncbi:F-box/kelch-repeat protein At3g23880-like [Silene latifolia]|uniref:F-box/kelch-repeat protein At3g23880-like n=1 Tax=Silene latifolia TaxID=37657 RepID=UPI003D76AC74